MLQIDSSFNEQIDDWIATSEQEINEYLGYTTTSGIFREAVVDEKYDARVTTDLDLQVFTRKTPIISVSSLSLVKGTSSMTLTLTDGTGAARYDIPSSQDYILYAGYQLSLTSPTFLRTFGDLANRKIFTKVSYIGGYATVPPQIRQATTMLTSDLIMRHVNKEGLEQITQGRITKRWKQLQNGRSDFYLDAISKLNPFRQAQRWF